MDVNQKIYGVHWEVDQEYPLWQFTSQNYLRLDVTAEIRATQIARIVPMNQRHDRQPAMLRGLTCQDCVHRVTDDPTHLGVSLLHTSPQRKQGFG